MRHKMADIAKCKGVEYDGVWRDGCEHCLRRTAEESERQAWIEPPSIIVFECEFLLEVEK